LEGRKLGAVHRNFGLGNDIHRRAALEITIQCMIPWQSNEKSLTGKALDVMLARVGTACLAAKLGSLQRIEAYIYSASTTIN
jgi:hypothetical protein